MKTFKDTHYNASSRTRKWALFGRYDTIEDALLTIADVTKNTIKFGHVPEDFIVTRTDYYYETTDDGDFVAETRNTVLVMSTDDVKNWLVINGILTKEVD